MIPRSTPLIRTLKTMAASRAGQRRNIARGWDGPTRGIPQREGIVIPRVMGKLGGKSLLIEPFFMSIFADELCESLKPELMVWAREKTVINHDAGLLLSGVFVFIAAHLGYFNLEQLNQHRSEIYSRTVEGETWDNPQSEMEQIVHELNEIMKVKKAFRFDDFSEMNSEWASKLAARLARVQKILSRGAEESPSIYGPEGFAA